MKKSKELSVMLKNMAGEWKWLFGYIGKHKFTIILYILLGAVSTVMSLGVTVASKYLIDAVVYHTDSVIVKYAVIVIGLAVFQYVLSALTSWITAVVSTKTNNKIRHEIYSHILSAQWRDISRFHSGDLLNRLEGDPYMDGEETEKMLRQAISQLPDKQRAVFMLRYFKETPYEEMSQMMGTSVGALKASYHLAVKKITTFFQQHD